MDLFSLQRERVSMVGFKNNASYVQFQEWVRYYKWGMTSMIHFLFHSIKGKFLFTFFTLIGAVFYFQFSYIAPHIEKRRMEDIKESQKSFANLIAEEINSRLDTAAKELKAMALIPGIVTLDKRSMDETIAIINTSNHFFNYYFVMDNTGKWLSYPSRPDLVGQSIPIENMGWVKKTFESKNTVFLDVVKSKIGTLVSGFSTPIVSNDTKTTALMRGVFVVSDANFLVKTIKAMKTAKGDQAYLVAANGWLIAHSHQKLNYSQFESYSMIDYKPVKQVLAGDSGIVNYSYHGKNWIAAFQPIGVTNWGLIVQRPLEQVVSEARSDARLIVFAILGVFFIGLSVAAVVVQKSLSPLFKLVKHIQNETIDSDADYPKDEIGQLALQYRNLFSELYRSNERIRNSEVKFRTLFNNANDAIFIHDVEGKFLEVNQKGVEYTGYTRKELLNMNLTDIDAPDAAKMGPSRLNELKLNNVLLFEATHLAKSKESIPVEISSRKIEYENRMAVLSVVRDLTERKKGEQALRDSHQRFLTVLDGIDATIYVADMDTHEILFMNKYMIESFGKDSTGETCWEAFRCESGPCPHCTNDQLVDEYGDPTGVHVWQDINPITKKWYINYDRAIKWIDDRLVRIQIATDITELKNIETERKKYDEKLRQAQKMEAIGTLAGGIAHDFNNLLMGIHGRASLMSYDLKSTHPCYEHVKAIMDYTRSASDLTRQLLGVARGGKFEVKPMDLNEIVSSSGAMFGRTRKEIRIHTKLHNRTPVVMVDRMQIEQVLLNLFVNAWQAMPQSGDIYLETYIVRLDEVYCKPHSANPGTYAKISVTDTGVGMDEAILPQIFDPFFSTKKKGRGTGLGLASAYGIVKNHGGIITVYSEVGHGTTFNVYLPLTDKMAEKGEALSHDLIKGKETILLIDDEQMINEVGKAMLEKLGYRVVVASSGEDGIEIINERSEDFDLVILDMIMPGMDGGKTFDHIREIHSTIPIILSSGYSLNGQAEEILNRGCNGFIQKPFDMETLSRKVHEVMNQGNSGDQG